MNQAYRNPNTPESASASNAMKVDLRVSFASTVVRKILFDVSGGAGRVILETYVIDHQRDGLNIDTARKDVGRNKHFGFPSTEGVNDDITLRRFESSSQASDLVTFGIKALLDS